MIVEARASVWPPTIIDYHQLSFSLSVFKFFMIVDDSFSRLTTGMIVHDSFSVSCFGNRRSDSGQYFLKCFTVLAEHFVVSSVLHSQFFHQFLHSAFVSPFDPFPCPFPSSTNSLQIHLSYIPPTNQRLPAAALFRREKFTLLQVCLTGRHLVFTSVFTWKGLGTRCSRNFARATASELSSTITNFFDRLTMWMIVGDSWW